MRGTMQVMGIIERDAEVIGHGRKLVFLDVFCEFVIGCLPLLTVSVDTFHHLLR